MIAPEYADDALHQSIQSDSVVSAVSTTVWQNEAG